MIRSARILAALALGCATLGAAAARAECLKLDCSHDPAAWGAMFGDTPAAKREQDATRRAVSAFSARATRQRAQEERGLKNLPPAQREALAGEVEKVLTLATQTPTTIVSASMGVRGTAFLVCGGALYGGSGDDTGVFIYDSNPGAPIIITHATRAQFAEQGCGTAQIGLR